MKKLISVVPVNLGQWKNFSVDSDVDRINGWKPCYFQEAVFNFGWLPKNCYGKLGIEMKESNEKETDIEVALGWQKAVKDGGRGVFSVIEESKLILRQYEPDGQRRWEIYESDFFKLPDYDGIILLWLLRRHPIDPQIINTVLSIAMWTLAIFEDVPDD